MDVIKIMIKIMIMGTLLRRSASCVVIKPVNGNGP